MSEATNPTTTPASKNFVTITGRLFENPRPKDNDKGYAIVTFDIARTDLKSKYALNKATGRFERNSVVGTVVLWNEVAMAGQRLLEKGDEVNLVGEFRTSEYLDHAGDKRVKVEFHAVRFDTVKKVARRDVTPEAIAAAYELLANQQGEEIDIADALEQ